MLSTWYEIENAQLMFVTTIVIIIYDNLPARENIVGKGTLPPKKKKSRVATETRAFWGVLAYGMYISHSQETQL